MIRHGRQAARDFAEVVPLAGMNDRQKLMVYDKLREAHKSITAIRCESGLLEDANDEEDAIVDAVETVLYMAEAHFARMGD